jgi:hypothetical protein
MKHFILRLLTFALLLSVSIDAAWPQSSVSAPAHRIQTIYVIPSSHWDLGFIAPPEEVLPRLKPHIDDVIANCKADPEFRWTIESVWQIREWLTRTNDPKQIKDFVDLVNKGQIQVSAVFGSMHTEFMGTEQLNRIVYDMKSLEKRLGIKTEFAMMDDVPGFTLRLPQVLARSGVKYFVNGSNLFIGGGTSLSPGKVPFYWQSPDGSQVLTWQTQSKFGGYTEAMADYYIDPLALEPYTKEHFYPKELNGKPPMEIMQIGVDKLLKKYQDAGYPYDSVMLLYLHDFIPPTWERDTLMPSVSAWNAAGKSPRIVIATPAEFFRHMESRYAGKFETHAGDWSGLWSAVKTNSPKISANARWSQDHFTAAESLWTLLTFREGTSFPSGNFEEDRLKLLKYDEHSGAAQVGWPKLMTRSETDQQNREYADYTREARADLQYLIDQGMQTLFAQKTDAATPNSIVVFNPTSWIRTGDVELNLPNSARLALRDIATGKLAASEASAPNRISFRAEDVPSFGYRTYAIVAAESAHGVVPKKAAASKTQIENVFYRLTVREADGNIVSLFDKERGIELLDPKGEGLNSLQRRTWFANLPIPIGALEIERHDGTLGAALTIRRPGSFWPETTITLPAGQRRVDIENHLDRAEMPYVASLQPGETYSFNFPFHFEGSASVWVDNGTGFHRNPDDYLPGSRTDAAVPQHNILLAGNMMSKPVYVSVSSPESFFYNLPGLPGVKDKNTFMNSLQIVALQKQDQGDTRELGMTNFANLEPGLENTPLVFHYAISSGGGTPDPAQQYRSGIESTVPMLAATLLPHTSPAQPSDSFFSISSSNVVILAFKPSADGDLNHYTLRLQEVAGKNSEVSITTRFKVSEAAVTSLTEDTVLQALTLPLKTTIGPHETKTLRLTIPHDAKTRSHRWWEW